MVAGTETSSAAAAAAAPATSPTLNGTNVPSASMLSGSFGSLAAAVTGERLAPSSPPPSLMAAALASASSMHHMYQASPTAAAAALPKPKRTPVACRPCHLAKTSCRGGRPCFRCIKRHSENLCHDVVHRKKGRPRKSTYSGSTSSNARGEGSGGRRGSSSPTSADDDDSSAPRKRPRLRSPGKSGSTPPTPTTPSFASTVGGQFLLSLSSLQSGTASGVSSTTASPGVSPHAVHPLMSISTDRPMSPYTLRGNGAQSPVGMQTTSLPLGITVGAAGTGAGPRLTLPLGHFPPEQAAAAAALAAAQAHMFAASYAASIGGRPMSDPSGLHLPGLQQLQQQALELSRSMSPSRPTSATSSTGSKPNISSPPANLFRSLSSSSGSGRRRKSSTHTDSDLSERMVSIKLEGGGASTPAASASSPHAPSASPSAARPSLQSIQPPKSLVEASHAHSKRTLPDAQLNSLRPPDSPSSASASASSSARAPIAQPRPLRPEQHSLSEDTAPPASSPSSANAFPSLVRPPSRPSSGGMGVGDSRFIRHSYRRGHSRLRSGDSKSTSPIGTPMAASLRSKSKKSSQQAPPISASAFFHQRSMMGEENQRRRRSSSSMSSSMTPRTPNQRRGSASSKSSGKPHESPQEILLSMRSLSSKPPTPGPSPSPSPAALPPHKSAASAASSPHPALPGVLPPTPTFANGLVKGHLHHTFPPPQPQGTDIVTSRSASPALDILAVAASSPSPTSGGGGPVGRYGNSRSVSLERSSVARRSVGRSVTPTLMPHSEKKLRQRTKVACKPCNLAKVSCRGGRPCDRCRQRSHPDLCVDVVHRRKGARQRKALALAAAAAAAGNAAEGVPQANNRHSRSRSTSSTASSVSSIAPTKLSLSYPTSSSSMVSALRPISAPASMMTPILTAQTPTPTMMSDEDDEAAGASAAAGVSAQPPQSPVPAAAVPVSSLEMDLTMSSLARPRVLGPRPVSFPVTRKDLSSQASPPAAALSLGRKSSDKRESQTSTASAAAPSSVPQNQHDLDVEPKREPSVNMSDSDSDSDDATRHASLPLRSRWAVSDGPMPTPAPTPTPAAGADAQPRRKSDPPSRSSATRASASASSLASASWQPDPRETDSLLRFHRFISENRYKVIIVCEGCHRANALDKAIMVNRAVLNCGECDSVILNLRRSSPHPTPTVSRFAIDARGGNAASSPVATPTTPATTGSSS